jgi:hypothetical protein
VSDLQQHRQQNPWLCKSIRTAVVVLAITKPLIIRLVQPRAHRDIPGLSPFEYRHRQHHTSLANKSTFVIVASQHRNKQTNIMPCGIGGSKTTQRKLVLLYDSSPAHVLFGHVHTHPSMQERSRVDWPLRSIELTMCAEETVLAERHHC